MMIDNILKNDTHKAIANLLKSYSSSTIIIIVIIIIFIIIIIITIPLHGKYAAWK